MTVFDLITDYRIPLIMLTRAGYVDKRMSRDIRIYTDYLDGKTVKEIASSERLSLKSIYIIVNKLKKIV
tara:strand:+ start:3724 stop:3930 length:207 start_codon:yes stop_codon:yes gene_type:complete